MKKLIPSLVFALASLAPLAQAGDLANLGSLNQSQFRTVSEDLGAAFSYKALIPTVGQGVTGFDLGVEVSGTDVSNSAGLLAQAGAGTVPGNTLLVSRLQLHKGLPWGIDLGAFTSYVPSIGGQVYGGELRYALVDGSLVKPAVGLRIAATQLKGTDQLSFNTRSVDISVSKGFAVLTPYGGIGQVWVNSSPNTGALTGESFAVGKLYAGVNINMGLVNFVFEGDRTGNVMSWGVKMGLRW